METDKHNIDQKAASKANGNEVESSDSLFASSALAPPPFEIFAKNKHTKKEEIGQETEDPGNEEIDTESVTQEVVQQKEKGGQKEKKEEEPEETTPEKLLFVSAPPDPGDDQNDDSSAAGNSGEGGDDQPPSQMKEDDGSGMSNGNSSNGVPEEVMSKMESTIGHNFSNVNIHTNSSQAKDVGALAYTQGTDIHFAPGQFNPSSSSGQELLGHELTHVKQQAEGRVVPTTQASNGMAVNDDKGLEAEADNFGAKAASSSQPVQKKNDNLNTPYDHSHSAQLKIAQFQEIAGSTRPSGSDPNIVDTLSVVEYITIEMNTNVNGPDVARLKNYAFYERVQKLLDFANLVKGGAVWDHKGEINNGFGQWSRDDTSGTEYFFDIWSNIHYGYIGKAAGFTDFELLQAPGLAQVADGTVPDDYDPLERAGDGLAGLDDPLDQEAIKVGFALWNSYGNSLTVEQVIAAVRANKTNLSTRPIGPAQQAPTQQKSITPLQNNQIENHSNLINQSTVQLKEEPVQFELTQEEKEQNIRVINNLISFGIPFLPVLNALGFEITGLAVGLRGFGMAEDGIGGGAGVDFMFMIDYAEMRCTGDVVPFAEVGLGIEAGLGAGIVIAYRISPAGNYGDIQESYEGPALNASLEAIAGIGFSISPGLATGNEGFVGVCISLGAQGGGSVSISYGISTEEIIELGATYIQPAISGFISTLRGIFDILEGIGNALQELAGQIFAPIIPERWVLDGYTPQEASQVRAFVAGVQSVAQGHGLEVINQNISDIFRLGRIQTQPLFTNVRDALNHKYHLNEGGTEEEVGNIWELEYFNDTTYANFINWGSDANLFSFGSPSNNSTQNQQGQTAQRKVNEKSSSSGSKSESGDSNNVMQKMESAFGTSFSDVNIHENSSSASENNALAYTQGSDIHFAPGQFKPDTTAGQELLGHELTHVVQQREGRVQPTTQLKSGMSVNDDPALENEADEMGRKAASINYNPHQKKADNLTLPTSFDINQLKLVNTSVSVVSPTSQLKVAQFEKTVETKGGFKVSEEGIEISITATPKKEIQLKYAKVEISAPITAKGEFKLKGDAPNKGGSMEQDTEGTHNVKARYEAYKKEIVSKGSSELEKMAYEKLKNDGMFDIVSADLEGGLELSDNAKETALSPHVSFVLKLQNGDKFTVSLNLFKFSTDENEGPALTGDYELAFPSAKFWENNLATASIGGNVNLNVKITPNYGRIIAELAKEEVKAAIRTSVMETMLGPGGFIAGFAVFIFCAYKSIQSISSIKDARKKAENAKNSYVWGYITELGVREYSTMKGGDIEYVQMGATDGNKALSKQVTIIQQHHLFKHYNFTRSELFSAIKEKCKANGSLVYSDIESKARAKLYPEFVNVYYNMRFDEWSTPEYIAFKDAKWVAIGLGLDESVIKRKPGYGDDAAQGKFKTSSSNAPIQKKDDEITLEGGTVNIIPDSKPYDVSGTYEDMCTIFDGKPDAGKIKPIFNNLRTIPNEGKNTDRFEVDITLTKVLPNWKEFPEIVKKSKDPNEKHQAYYARVVKVWTKFMAQLDRHETGHFNKDKTYFKAMPTALKGKSSEKLGAHVTEYAKNSKSIHDEFHGTAEAHIDPLPYIQKEVEKVGQRKTTQEQKSSETSSELKGTGVVQKQDSNLDLTEAGGHPNRNQFNQFPTGLLSPKDGSENPFFEYREDSHVFVDEAGREWTMLPDSKNVYHQPPEVVDGFFDNLGQEISSWWNDTERDPFPNKKFISRDDETGGSFEAILQPNADGSYTNNWLNSGTQQGTYNFYSPEGFWGNVGHFMFDVLPHYANDDYAPTPVQQKSNGPIQKSPEDDRKELKSLLNIIMEPDFLLAFIEENALSYGSVIKAVKNAAYSGAQSHRNAAAITYVTAAQANHPVAGDVASGAITVKSVDRKEYKSLTGSEEGDGFYSTMDVATTGQQADTLYLANTITLYELDARALIIHELTHANDDKNAIIPDGAAHGAILQMDFEINGYRAQSKYLMDQLIAANEFSRDSVKQNIVNLLNGPLGIIFAYCMLIETKDDDAAYHGITIELIADPSTGISAEQVENLLSQSQADLLIDLETEMARLPMYAGITTGRIAVDGLEDPPAQKKSVSESINGNASNNTLQLQVDHVNIHENSSKASELGALAFTQGNDIHFAPGQYKPDTRSGQELLGHELGHVQQQKQGRVQPNTQINNKPVNDDPGLEKEADDFGVAFANDLQNQNPIQNKTQDSFKLNNTNPYQFKSNDSVVPFSLNGTYPIQRKEDPIQRWPDISLPSWDDVTGAAGDAWDATGGRVVDAVGDGIDWASETLGDAWDAGKEAALRTALAALNGAQEVIEFLASLSQGIARKAIDILAQIDLGVLIDIMDFFPGHALIGYIINVVADVIDDVQQIVAILARVSKSIAETFLQVLSSVNIDMIVDFIIQLPSHIFAAYAFLLLNTQRMAQVLFNISVDLAAAIIKKIVEGGRFIRNIVYAILMGTVEFMKNLLAALGQAIIRMLIEGYRIFLEVVKKVIDFIWPVGYGINLEGGIGATFGIPVHVGVDYVSYIQHKSTPVMYFFRQGIVRGGLDTGVGAGAFVGSGRSRGGSGDQAGQQWGVGAEAGVNAEAGLQAKVIQEFDFPIYEDIAFISFILAITGNDVSGISGLATKLVDQIPGVNLDPMRYNTKTKFEFGIYAGASAEANAGIRMGGNDGNGNANGSNTNTWDRSERGNTNQQVEGPWYSPINLIRKLNVGANAGINLGAGLGVEMRQDDFREDESGNRIPYKVELDLYGEGSVAANINANLPVPLPLNGLGVDATVGVKGTWEFIKTGSGNNDIQKRFKGSAPYFNTGNMDVIDANASETELMSTGSALDFEEFIAGIQSLKHKQRIGLSSAFGRKFMSSARRQGAVRSLLGRDYRHTGATFAGFLTYEFMITKANLQAIMRTLFEFYNNHVTDGNWQNMLIDFIHFFRTGEIPNYMINLVADIVSRINVTQLTARLQAGISIAAGAQASEGLKVRLDGRFAAGIFRETNLLAELGDGALSREEIRDLLLNGAAYLGLSENDNPAGATPQEQHSNEQTPPENQPQEPTPTTLPTPAETGNQDNQNHGQNGNQNNDETPLEQRIANEPSPELEPNAAPGDSIQSNIFSDGRGGVQFDEELLEHQFMGSTFQGADSLSLRLAMMALYGSPNSGFRYNMALTAIAEARGLTFQKAESDYHRALAIRATGRANYRKKLEDQGIQYDPEEHDPSPNLNLGQHPLFTASDGQLRFGKILGDVFGIDAVFGSLISPTGGLVGPGNSFVGLSNLDPENPVSIHGTVHDAAGYLYNCHHIGPGYDYLDREQGEDPANPLSGQTNINWWNDAYRRQGREVPWSAEFLGRGSYALNAAVEGEARREKGYDHDPAAEEELRELAPTHMLYEIAAHDIAYKPNRGAVPQAVLESMANNGYMTDNEAGMKFFQGPMGFRAVLILPKPGSGKLPLLAIRGTNPGTSRADLETVMTDLDEAAVGAQQFQLNAVLIQAILQSAGGRADVTGHSLGGAMAQHTAVNFSSMVANVVTFQSPGIDQESIDRFNSLPEDARPNVTHHIVTGDVVDKAGQGNLAGDVYEHDFGSFINLFQLLEDIQRHTGVVKSAAENLLDIDFRHPSQNIDDYNHLKLSFNNFKNFLTEVGSSVGGAHSTRVFSAANYDDIRREHGVSDNAFAGGEADSGNMARTEARLGRFSGHPHADERRLAEAVRSALGPELQRLFRLVFRAMEAYESFKSSAQGMVDSATGAWDDINSSVGNAVENIRNRLPF